MYLFPVVGIVIGLLVGSVGFGLSLFLDPLLVALLVVVVYVVLTGIHHADGLADFADGLAAGGDRGKRLGAMKDLSTGSAGVVGMVLCIVGIVAVLFLLGEHSGIDLFRAILVSEILAKFSMVMLASLGRSAALGSGAPFVESMRHKKRPIIASAIMLAAVIPVGGAVTGLVALVVVSVVVAVILLVSVRRFGGITGDVLGATNELSRLASLMAFVVLL